MFALRVLSIRDVINALKRREPVLALRISHNLCSNALNSARFRLQGHALVAARRTSRRAS